MLKKTVTYEAFDGTTVKETLYFNLTKTEIMKAEVTGATIGENDELQNSFSDRLRKISQSKNPQEVIDTFMSIVEMAYGVRSEDGKRFYKRPSDLEDFKASGAYDAFIMQFIAEPDQIEAFVKGVLPDMSSFEAKEDSGKVDLKTRMAERLGTTTQE